MKSLLKENALVIANVQMAQNCITPFILINY
jgi:hypothetical protein